MTEETTQPLGNQPEARDAAGTLVNGPSTTNGSQQEQTTTSQAESTTQTANTTDKPAEKPGDKAAQAGAPEKYEAFTVPDGYELDAKVAEEAGAIFKELGLPQAAAQKLVDFYAKQTGEAFEQPMRAYEEMRTGWRNEVVTNPALGDGKDLKPEVKATLGRAIDSMGAKEATAFRAALDLTGAGDNPAVIAGLYALAQLATEGRPVRAGGPAPVSRPGGRPSPAAALFPNLPSGATS